MVSMKLYDLFDGAFSVIVMFAEFDLHVEHHSKYVFNEKRAKFKQTYNEVINLYRQEKKDEKVKELEQKMLQYEAERSRKAQQFRRFYYQTENVW